MNRVFPRGSGVPPVKHRRDACATFSGIVAALLGCLTFPAGTLAVENSTAAAAKVDKLLVAELFADGKQKPAPRAGDETFLRRVSLDLVGQLPSPEQAIAFSLDPAANKRTAVVDRLLANPRFGANWGAYWRDVIMYRSNDQRARIAAGSLTRFLAGELNRGASWDKVATAMLTARGDVRENGATGLIMAQLGRPAETTAEVSRIFLGIQLQCAQCHDHKTDRWRREQFHQLAAFFPRTAVRPVRNGTTRSFIVVASDNPPRFRRPNNNNRYAGTLEYFMPDLDDPKAAGKRMTPTLFTSGQTLKLGTPDAQRRETLAKWITDKKNPWFAKAFVNRIWAEMVGEGFHEPIDDMGPDRKASAPKTFDYLAGWFAETGYDVKALYRVIAATEAYQRESRSRRKPNDKPFAASCPQRLRADQLYAQLDRALGMGRLAGAGGGRFGAQAQFNQLFGYDPSTPRGEVGGSIAQALMMMNSPIINRYINGRDGRSALGRLLRETSDDESVVVELYLRTLARQPKDGELKKSLDYVKETGNRVEAFEDLLWALVNSTEFLHRK